MKPDCYKCIHRRDLAGDAHSQCQHPKASIAYMAGVPSPLNIKGDSHGIRNGWFMWPMNYDPIWLKNCDGFTPAQQPQDKP